MFDGESWLEEKRFTILHKIILGLTNSRTLEDELSVSSKLINHPDSQGRTPLSWAAERGDRQAVKTLSIYKADLATADREGNTALHYACQAQNPEVLHDLLAAGAPAAQRNVHAQTPLNWAAFHQDDPRFAEALLAQPGADVNERDLHSVTALANAAFRAHATMLAFLLDRGADINQADADECPPLLDSIVQDHNTALRVLLRRGRACGLNVAYRTSQGDSCLHYLARCGTPATIEAFLEAFQEGWIDAAGLDAAHVGRNGLAPRDLLRLRGDDHVATLMEEALCIVERETVEERRSDSSEEAVFLDSFELLPQWEKDIGLKEPRVQIAEIVSI